MYCTFLADFGQKIKKRTILADFHRSTHKDTYFHIHIHHLLHVLTCPPPPHPPPPAPLFLIAIERIGMWGCLVPLFIFLPVTNTKKCVKTCSCICTCIYNQPKWKPLQSTGRHYTHLQVNNLI